jgi:hypothetical protein
MAPACKSLLRTLTDTVVAAGVHGAEQQVNAVAGGGSGGLP